MPRLVIGSVLTLALTSAALGQDSVSKLGGLPGDAISPYSSNEQNNRYVVDLTPFTASWGTQFNIGPIGKASKGDPLYFNDFVNASALSATIKNARFPFQRYFMWNTAGFGINNDATLNDAPSFVTRPAGGSKQAVAAWSESSGDYNGIVSVVMNWSPNNPARLYCARIPAAANGIDAATNSAQFGFGGVDSDSQVAFRADDFGVTSSNAIVGNNIFRVRALDRDRRSVNVIDTFGAADTGTWVVEKVNTTHNCPTVVDSGRAGRGLAITTNFSSEYVHEVAPGYPLGTFDHLGGRSDHRGNVSYNIASLFPHTSLSIDPKPYNRDTKGVWQPDVGTVAMYGKDANDDTRSILLWGLEHNGAVDGTHQIDLPGSITDRDDGHVFASIDGFIHYRSQTSYRGGNGPVAVGADGHRKILVATPVITSSGGGASDDPINAIAVARLNPLDLQAPAVWTLAGWNELSGGAGNGKLIKDGPGGNAVGRLVRLADVTGGSPQGPSMSAPSIDSAGNIWFQAAVELFKGGFSDFDTALIRGVYDEATFSYELELVVELGQVVRGQNSDRDYQISYMSIADNNSISSSSNWSGNIVQQGFNGLSSEGLPRGDARALGGFAFSCSITYDSNQDGTFDTGSGDERYNVMLFLGAD